MVEARTLTTDAASRAAPRRDESFEHFREGMRQLKEEMALDERTRGLPERLEDGHPDLGRLLRRLRLWLWEDELASLKVDPAVSAAAREFVRRHEPAAAAVG